MNPYYESENVKLYCGDCLSVMPQFEAQSFDAILTDVPYGTTACSWDVVIPFPEMWKVVKHVLKKKGAFVTTASQPFTSKLVCSNLEWFKYEWIWEKNFSGGFITAKKMPMKSHENILVFYAEQPTYNPIFEDYAQSTKNRFKNNGNVNSNKARARGDANNIQKIKIVQGKVILNRGRYPKTVQRINGDPVCNGNRVHPTQKPEALYRYLALTYTNPENTVLDFCMGSGTTGVACVQTGRKFVGIEISQEYCDIAVKRIKDAEQQMRLF